jgi:hypothetical protein
MATRRENALAALAHRPTAYPPVHFLCDQLSQPQPLPARLGEDPFDIGIQRFLGGDVLDRIGGGCALASETPQVQQTTEPWADGSVHTTWETPLGRLTRAAMPEQGGRVQFTVDMPIKQAGDYAILRYIVEHTRYTVDDESLTYARSRLRSIGDDGIAYTAMPESPIQQLIRGWTMLDRLVFDLADCPAVVADVLAAMHALNCQYYELACRVTPASVVVCWDDANNQQISRRMLERYWVPAIRDYAAICHRYDKLYVLHDCGRLRGLVDLFADAGIDAIDWCSPPPTGDVTWAEVQQACGGRVCVMGATPAPIMRYGTPGEVEASLRVWLDGVDLERNFLLQILCPLGTPLANAARAVKVLHCDYGFPLNQQPGYRPIWEDPAAAW